MKRPNWITWTVLLAVFAIFTGMASNSANAASPTTSITATETACSNGGVIGIGATLYNAGQYNIGIKHWPSSPGVFEFVLAVGHCSTEHYVDCEMAWVSAGRDYSLQRQNLSGTWTTISAGHGGRYVNLATNDHFRIYQWKTGSKAPAASKIGHVSANSAIPAALTKGDPNVFLGLGADLYNEGPTTVTIEHWWDANPNYVAHLAVGHWSDEYWQNNQAVYAPSGRGYGLYKYTSSGWVAVSAGRGPVRLHLTAWIKYKIRTWA